MTSQRFEIGLVGTENSHAEEIIKYLNREEPDGVAHIVALAGGETPRNLALAELGGITTITERSDELLGAVDAMIVTTRDGRLHREQAVPFLSAGIPVWVDKPLACSTEDASKIIDAAANGGTRVTSYSPLRWIADTAALVDEAGELGEMQTVTVTGPADATSEYGGLFFYGIHVADVAQRLAGSRTSTVTVQQLNNIIVAEYRTSRALVRLELVLPGPDGRVPFRATVVGRSGIATRELRLGEGYVRPGVGAFLGMLSNGTAPLTREEMIEPISVLEEAVSSL